MPLGFQVRLCDDVVLEGREHQKSTHAHEEYGSSYTPQTMLAKFGLVPDVLENEVSLGSLEVKYGDVVVAEQELKPTAVAQAPTVKVTRSTKHSAQRYNLAFQNTRYTITH